MSQPSICAFCYENIVRAEVSWNFHHPSYSSLASSAHRRCAFCTVLHEDVQKHRPAIAAYVSQDETLQNWLPGNTQKLKKLPLSAKKALHRWSVRSLGRTRESKLVIAITFRVVPKRYGSDAQSNQGRQTFGLPERVFYCFPEEDLGPLWSPLDLGTNSDPEINEGLQIKKWIRNCGIEHKHCPKRAGAGGKFVPTRLLHIGGKRRGDPIRVVDTKSNKIKGPYVTLSHCWGESEAFRPDTLRSDSMFDYLNAGVPWSYLSRTFQEAIRVAWFLEIDYIWIDSLCIIQGRDESAVNDWNREGALMHKVYRNSYCNIAAADAKDSTKGLFRERMPHDVSSARFQADGDSLIFEQRVWRAVREDLWEQERMLAPRILHFSKHQVFWDCAEMSACETLPAGLPLPLDRSSAIDRHWRGRLQEAGTNQAILVSAVNDDSPEDFWKLAVESFTSLDLKFQTDKRRAIWGIAKLMRDSLDEEYAAGMWETGLEEQLAWRVSDCTIASRPKELTSNPSWSWTSIKGKVLIEGRSQLQDRIYQATDHANQPLSFDIGDKNLRPALPREPSETFQEELVAMGRDLELVEERRRKSGTSSRHQSLTGISTSIHNSQAGMEDSVSNTSTPLGARAMSPQQTVLDLEAKGQNSGQATRKNSGMSASKYQDTESELVDKKIAIKGYLLQGLMSLRNNTGGWTIELVGPVCYNQEDIVIEAFPDVKHDAAPEPIHFVILALSEQFERHASMFSSDELDPTQKSCYVGQGIMLRPSGNKLCYVRTGAFKIRCLSASIWEYIRTGGQVLNGTAQDTKAAVEVRFFVV
ncbi:Nn.00g039710.m01.CDS01 [Neocucurbitaria sp. VM-36]